MITRGVPFTLYCLFIASGDTGYFVWGGGGGGEGVVIEFLFSYVLIFVLV